MLTVVVCSVEKKSLAPAFKPLLPGR